MDAAAWIRSRLEGSTCAACGRPYRRDGIRVLARREALFFVALDCAGCATESVAIVSLEHGAGALSGSVPDAPPASSGRVRRAEAAPVDAADVLAMHEFLDRFDGDFQALFGSTRDRSSSAGSA